jgi:hypothetical protein
MAKLVYVKETTDTAHKPAAPHLMPPRCREIPGIGAGDGNRTHDILLGKQTLYL